MSVVADIQPSSEVLARADLPFLFNARGLTSIGVEIGVDRGTYSQELLTYWKGRELYCVDPWLPYPDMPWDREADYFLAMFNLAPFGDRVRLCRTTSVEFSKVFGRGYLLSFVYIDGSHEYETVAADIATWWDQLPLNGILAGHDFDHEHLGVRRAVTEFAVRIGRPIRQTTSGEEPASFYFYRTEPASEINVMNHATLHAKEAR